MSKRFVRGKRGVSAVIGTIFFVTILFAGFSMIMWVFSQYNAYMKIVNEKNQLDWERQNEMIEIVSLSIVSGKLNISVTNRGSVMVHLVDLWITNLTAENWHKLFQIDYYVNPGNTTTNIGQELGTVNPSFTYRVKIVTERGNIAIKSYGLEEEEESPPSVRAFGVFSMDWFYFSYTSETHPEPVDAGIVHKRDNYVAFYVKITNNYDESVTVLSPSLLMLLVEWQEPHLNLVQSVSYASTTNYWETDWDYTNGQRHTGSYSIHAGSSDTYLTSHGLSTSDATSITVSFWYRDDDIDDSDDVYLQFWDGSTYDNIFELGNTSPEDTWHFCTVTTVDSQYCISDFHIRFDATSIDPGENLWIDDVLVTKMSGEEITLLSDGFEYSPPVIIPYDDENPVTVHPHESATLIFAAANAGLDVWAWEDEMPYYQSGTEGAIVMTALVFTLESDPTQMCAQSLPFQALVLFDD
jgi:hypothetical protein